jgi:hypothetical protein
MLAQLRHAKQSLGAKSCEQIFARAVRPAGAALDEGGTVRKRGRARRIGPDFQS